MTAVKTVRGLRTMELRSIGNMVCCLAGNGSAINKWLVLLPTLIIGFV